MKKRNQWIVASLMLSATFISCENEDNETPGISPVNVTELKSIAESGAWVITHFFDTDKEETADYDGYTFTFGANGTLTATNGTTDVSGTWSITDSDDDSSDDDGSSDDVDFNIMFASPADFEELSDDWYVVSYSNSRIELVDVSGGNGGTDTLVFERN